MKLLTKALRAKLEKNAESRPGAADVKPVVKLFNPAGAGTWLLTELDGDLAFGLADLGMGSPELGYVSLSELENLRLPFGLKVERDRYFEASKSLAEYAEEARNSGFLNA